MFEVCWFKSRTAGLGKVGGELKGGRIKLFFAIKAGGLKGACIEVQKDILTASIIVAARLSQVSILVPNSDAEQEFAFSFRLNGTLAAEVRGGNEDYQKSEDQEFHTIRLYTYDISSIINSFESTYNISVGRQPILLGRQYWLYSVRLRITQLYPLTLYISVIQQQSTTIIRNQSGHHRYSDTSESLFRDWFTSMNSCISCSIASSPGMSSFDFSTYQPTPFNFWLMMSLKESGLISLLSFFRLSLSSSTRCRCLTTVSLVCSMYYRIYLTVLSSITFFYFSSRRAVQQTISVMPFSQRQRSVLLSSGPITGEMICLIA